MASPTKKPPRTSGIVGRVSGLRRTEHRNFGELRKAEVQLRRTSLPRRWVNRGMFGGLLRTLGLGGTVHQCRVHLADPRDAAQTVDQGEQFFFLAALA